MLTPSGFIFSKKEKKAVFSSDLVGKVEVT